MRNPLQAYRSETFHALAAGTGMLCPPAGAAIEAAPLVWAGFCTLLGLVAGVVGHAAASVQDGYRRGKQSYVPPQIHVHVVESPRELQYQTLMRRYQEAVARVQADPHLPGPSKDRLLRDLLERYEQLLTEHLA